MKTVIRYFSSLALLGILTPVVCLSDVVLAGGQVIPVSITNSSIKDHQDEINRLEIDVGPYSEELIKPMLSIGILQSENQLYANAAEAFDSALHIHRINNGLHELQQLPILDLIISNNLSQQNWKAANKNYHLYHWLHRRNYEETDSRMLAVIDKLIAWHLLGTNLETGPHPGEHFVKLLDLNERALHIVENYPVPDDLELARRLYKLALIHYYIAIAVQRGAAVGQYLLQKFNPIQNGRSYESSSDQIVRKRFRRSRQLINRIATLYSYSSSATRDSDAITLVYLADWDLLFNRPSNAKRGYLLAYNKLLESGFSRELVNSFFLQPKLLPKSEFTPNLMVQYASGKLPATSASIDDNQSSVPGTEIEFVGWSTALPGVKFPAAEINSIVSPNTERYSLVSFNVLKDGLTEDIVISRDNPENSLPRHATYNAIWSAQFRPRLQDGKAVAVSGMSTRFYLPSIENKK